MAEGPLADAVAAARRAYAEAGNEVAQHDGARFVTNRVAPQVWDANHAGAVGEVGPVDPVRLLDAVEQTFAWAQHRQVRVARGAPPAIAAHLAVAGYSLHTEIDLVLPEGQDVPAGPAVGGFAIRRVDGVDDERSLLRLTRADHEEEAADAARDPWPEEVTRQMVEVRLGKAPALRFFLASVDGVDVGFFSSFPPVPGGVGVAIVEDLYTTPAHRGQGIARALIRHCVADARARGAGPVCIGADPDDWPKAWYARLGFEPTTVRDVYDRSA